MNIKKSLLLVLFTLFVSGSAKAANYNCLVTSEQDAGTKKPGMLRYYLERTLSLHPELANCPPPAQAGDAKVSQFEQVIVFNTKEFTGTANEVSAITLDRPLNLKDMQSNVVVGNWTPEMLTDSSSNISYPADYVSGNLANYGTVFLDARTNLNPASAPFECASPVSHVAYLRNMVIWSHHSWSQIKEKSPCVLSAGAVYVCKGTGIKRNPVDSSTDSVPESMEAHTGRVGDPLSKGLLTNPSWCNGQFEVVTPEIKKEFLCNDGVDNDGDNKIDCADSDCAENEVCNSSDTDNDGDGYSENDGDCDDADAAVNPGASDNDCDGVDNDCDGVADENCTEDADGDGYTESEGDCNDNDALVNPGATEICFDGVDNDCDGTSDENCYDPDTDNDGDGVTENQGDCDDDDPSNFPGNTESCADGSDNDCDGITNEGCTDPDVDDDSDGFTENGGDCNDENASINPSASEVCEDDVDNNCDGTADEGCNDPEVDDDSDGFTENQGDCNDADSSMYPGATEICDGKDNDCDGVLDDGLSQSDFHLDVDGDGYGDPNRSITACSVPAGYSMNDQDCDDEMSTVYPGALEICADGIDNDCDLTVDELTCSTGLEICNDDVDNDSDTLVDCNDSECEGDSHCQDQDGDGYSPGSGDCADLDPTTYPNAPEICDHLDNDCDSTIDEMCETNEDGDGDGYTPNDGDCDDNNVDVNPGVQEVCGDDIDNNCDRSSDEGCMGPTDTDDDGDGFTENQGDCNDVDASIHPGATDVVSDGIDQDCDGFDASVSSGDIDEDGDGYASDVDCDDTDPSIHPDAQELCDDGVDNDCDGISVDAEDLGANGFTTLGLSCQISAVPAGSNNLSGGGDCSCNFNARSAGRHAGVAESTLIVGVLAGLLFLRRQRTSKLS